MTEEEWNEALDVRDEYFHVSDHCKNEPWWNDLINESKNGNIENYIKLWVDNEVDETYAYYIWMYHRGPFREDESGNLVTEPMDDLRNFSFTDFMSLL